MPFCVPGFHGLTSYNTLQNTTIQYATTQHCLTALALFAKMISYTVFRFQNLSYSGLYRLETAVAFGHVF